MAQETKSSNGLKYEEQSAAEDLQDTVDAVLNSEKTRGVVQDTRGEEKAEESKEAVTHKDEENADNADEAGTPAKDDTDASVSGAQAEDETVNPEDNEALKEALKKAKAAGAASADGEGSDSDSDESATGPEVPKSKVPLAIGITVAVFIIVAAGVYLVLSGRVGNFGSGKPASVVEDYLKGYQNKDVNAIIATYPDFLQKQIKKSNDPADIWKELDSTFSGGLGDDWKATYSMGDSSEMSSEELKTMENYIKQAYGETVSVTRGYWVNATMNLKGSKNETSMPMQFAVLEIKGKYSIVYETTVSDNSGSSSESGSQAASE